MNSLCVGNLDGKGWQVSIIGKKIAGHGGNVCNPSTQEGRIATHSRPPWDEFRASLNYLVKLCKKVNPKVILPNIVSTSRKWLFKIRTTIKLNKL